MQALKPGVRLQFFEGQGVIVWDDRALSADESNAIGERLREISSALREETSNALERAKTKEEFERLASSYMKDAGDALEATQAELKFRQQEVEQLSKKWAKYRTA